MRLVRFIIFLNVYVYAMQPADSELFPESLARVDVIDTIPDWYSLVSLQQWQKDDVLDKILTWPEGYWKKHFSHPWLEKRRLIAALIYAGADPNLPDSKKYYNRPLIDAAGADDFHLVQFLCNHGAKPALTDPTLDFSRLLRCTKKTRIARYLLENGAQVKSDIYLLDHVMGADYSSKLVALYLSIGVSFNSSALCEGSILHSLAIHAKDYVQDDPKLFKKCNILLTHLPDEVVLALLTSGYRKPNSYSWVPFETPEQYSNKLHTHLVDVGYLRGNPNARKLSVIFKSYREALEQKIKARQADVPSCSH